MSIIQPLPAYSGPPMIQSIGMNTSLPEFGPFWNAPFTLRASLDRLGCFHVTAAKIPPAEFYDRVKHYAFNVMFVEPSWLVVFTEIARVLKPGGVAVISDFIHTRKYAAIFQKCGLRVERGWRSFSDTFPPLSIITARKQ